MSPEKDKELCEKYPKIFRDRHAPMTQTAMCWGFDCGDGWYNIINVLCSQIQGHVDNKIRQQKYSLGRGEITELIPEEDPQVIASQVKEKFGTLRFYVDGADEYTYGLIDMAESMSACVCEMCGNPGKLYDDGWCKTRCDSCVKSDK